MRKITTKIVVAVMLSSSLIASYPYSTYAVESAKPVVNNSLSKPLSIEGKGTIELKTIFNVPNQEGQVVAFSLEIVNRSNELLDFGKYWIRLQSKTGSKYPIKMADEQLRTRIFPGQKQSLIFYANLPKTVKMSDLQLRFIKWDSSMANFEQDLGFMVINANVIPTQGRSLSKFVGLTNNQLEARVEQGEIKQDEQGESKQAEVNYILKLINKGQQSLTLPAYQYILVTDSGVAYPLNTQPTEKDGDQSIVLPWIEKEIELNGVLPNSVDLSKVTLYILYPHGGDKGNTMIPVTLFKVFEKPAVESEGQNQFVDIGTDVELKLYGVKRSDELKGKLVFSQIQRFPWDHRDLLSAKVKLINTSDKKMAIPQLEGSIQLEKSFETNAEMLISNPEKKELNPGESVSYQLLGYIPYASSFRNGVIAIREKAESNEYKKQLKSKIPNYAFTDRATEIGQVVQNASYIIGETGSQNSLRLGDASTYSSANGNLIVTRLNVNNLEQRGREIPSLRGYFRTNTGTIYPAIMGDHDANNFPNGSSVISFWAELPKEVKQQDVTLIVGEEIKEKGIKDGVGFALPEDTLKLADKIDTINFYPYTLTFSDFYAESKGNISFHFKVKKTKNFSTKSNLNGRNLVFEFTNPFGEVLSTQNAKLEGDGAWDGDETLSIPEDSTDLGKNVFTLTIYDEYNGTRKALAKQTFAVYRFNNN